MSSCCDGQRGYFSAELVKRLARLFMLLAPCFSRWVHWFGDENTQQVFGIYEPQLELPVGADGRASEAKN